MNAVAHPQFALRPFLLEDTPLLAEIFRASVEELTADDYNEQQQEAWASAVDDEEEFAQRLEAQLTLIATMLVDALEKLSAARGAKRLTADVSDSAQDFFKKRGFTATQRNTIQLGGEWLANTTMEKKTGKADGQT
jgi:putative acetyltransferase